MLIFADNSFVILSHSAPLCKSFTSFWQIIDRTLLFGHNGKAVILSSGKEVYHGRYYPDLYCICCGKHSGVLYLQVVGQVLIITAGPKQKTGSCRSRFFVFLGVPWRLSTTLTFCAFIIPLLKIKVNPFILHPVICYKARALALCALWQPVPALLFYPCPAQQVPLLRPTGRLPAFLPAHHPRSAL